MNEQPDEIEGGCRCGKSRHASLPELYDAVLAVGGKGDLLYGMYFYSTPASNDPQWYCITGLCDGQQDAEAIVLAAIVACPYCGYHLCGDGVARRMVPAARAEKLEGELAFETAEAKRLEAALDNIENYAYRARMALDSREAIDEEAETDEEIL